MSESAPKTFNLLSIGQRGVGKTVFLAGTYAQLHPQHSSESLQGLWLDCQDKQAKENLEGMLSYITQTGQYPPLTVKVTDFNFSLEQSQQGATQTLCYFRWWDIPGEICDIHNPEFTRIVSSSHGCCVFIDAQALLHQPNYRQTLKDIVTQVAAIAVLIALNKLKYAFVIILTKCDLLQSSSAWQQQLEDHLQPLLSRLKAATANYKIFYSAIPIATISGKTTLQAKDSASPLLWLLQELRGVHRSRTTNNLFQWLPRLQQKRFQPPALVESLTKRRSVSAGGSATKISKVYFISAVALAAVVVGIGSILFERRASSFKDYRPLEKAQHLAIAFVAVDQITLAEALYDEILANQENNLKALVSKAVLRRAQGDIEAARSLLEQAEAAASQEQKPEIRELAQGLLQGDGN